MSCRDLTTSQVTWKVILGKDELISSKHKTSILLKTKLIWRLRLNTCSNKGNKVFEFELEYQIRMYSYKRYLFHLRLAAINLSLREAVDL